MTGIEKIQEMIAEDAKNECQKIFDDTSARVKDILISARKKASLLSLEIVSKAEEKASLIEKTSKLSAETLTRNKYLEIRNAILNDIISAAFEEIEKMSDEDYFNMLLLLCKKNIIEGECVLFLNSRDLDRLPEDFELRLNSEVFETSAVYISQTPADIENGFLLTMGNVTVNCTLRSVFDENMDALKDKLSAYLFKN